MKTIIVGIDFTRSSLNAANYAAFLSQKLNAKLVLFNMYEVPLIHSNSGLYFMSNAPLREQSENNLTKVKAKLEKQFPKIEIDMFVSTGFFKQQITSFVKSHKVQLVVLGISSKDRFSKFLYGSHSTDIAGKISAPVIIVPDHFKDYTLRKVVLAVDNKEKLHKSSLKAFETLIKETKTTPSLLHIKTEDEIFTDKAQNVVKINGKNYKVESFSSTSTEKGIGNYTKLKKTDLIVIISKKHSVFYNLFNESNTKKIAYSSKVPVMAIHE